MLEGVRVYAYVYTSVDRLIELGTALRARGVELVSSGGTADALRKANINVTDVSTVTGFAEVFGGIVIHAS